MLKRHGTRQRYRVFLSFIPLKIYLFKVQSSFVRINLFQFRSDKPLKYFVSFKGLAQEMVQVYLKNQIIPSHNTRTVGCFFIGLTQNGYYDILL